MVFKVMALAVLGSYSIFLVFPIYIGDISVSKLLFDFTPVNLSHANLLLRLVRRISKGRGNFSFPTVLIIKTVLITKTINN